MKRQRGRGRKPGGGGGNYHNSNQGGHHHPNRTLESNGPEVKVRGPASHVYERYLQLARDAQSSGDRVLSENYLQHADHYFRLVRSMQPAQPVQPQQNFNDGDYEGDEEGAPEGDGVDEVEARGENEEPAGGEYQGERQPHEGGDRGDGGQRRGRNRRRFRPDGDREGGFEAREGGEERAAPREPRGERSDGGEPREAREPRRERSESGEQREPRPPRRERQPREDRDVGGREGFSDGPKPAFLRSGGGSSE